MKIFNQWQKMTCANYAVIAILDKYWIKCDVERIWSIKAPFIWQLENLFKNEGLIKGFVTCNTSKIVDRWLSKWEYLLTSTARWDFTLFDNNGWLLEFDWKTQHYFVIIEDCWDKYRCQNSWGAEWNWDWTFYMKKSEFNYLMRPRRVIIK